MKLSSKIWIEETIFLIGFDIITNLLFHSILKDLILIWSTQGSTISLVLCTAMFNSNLFLSNYSLSVQPKGIRKIWAHLWIFLPSYQYFKVFKFLGRKCLLGDWLMISHVSLCQNNKQRKHRKDILLLTINFGQSPNKDIFAYLVKSVDIAITS